MAHALFLGCTVPARSLHYELSARAVARALEFEFVDIADFGCCGFPLASIDPAAAQLMALRNLALASAESRGIVTLCSACTLSLRRAARAWQNDASFRYQHGDRLARLGRKLEQEVEVTHLARFLYHTVGPESIASRVTHPLEGIKAMVHYGCHLVRPGELNGSSGEAERPGWLDDLLCATGLDVVGRSDSELCCGGSLLGIEEPVALAMADRELARAAGLRADVLVSACPFCSVMYEDNQPRIQDRFRRDYRLPVLFFTQILGLALGLDPDALGMKFARVPVEALLSKTA